MAAAGQPHGLQLRNDATPDRHPPRPLSVSRKKPPPVTQMLRTLAIVLVILWLLGLVSTYTMGGFIHILLVVAVVMVLVEVISGRKRG